MAVKKYARTSFCAAINADTNVIRKSKEMCSGRTSLTNIFSFDHNENSRCEELCTRTLRCGHTCSQICSELCGCKACSKENAGLKSKHNAFGRIDTTSSAPSHKAEVWQRYANEGVTKDDMKRDVVARSSTVRCSGSLSSVYKETIRITRSKNELDHTYPYIKQAAIQTQKEETVITRKNYAQSTSLNKSCEKLVDID